MERRTFVKNLATGLAAIPFLPALSEALSEQLQALSADFEAAGDDRARWQRVRKEFLLNPGLVHLNTGSIGLTPRLVIDAIATYMHTMEADPYHNTFGGLGEEGVRDKAAAFLGAAKDEIALTRNTTEGMNTIASGLDLKPGDEILTTNHEHGGGMVCWQHLAKYRGVKVVCLKMPNPVQDKGQILQLVADHLTPRTRVCSFSHVDTITGLQMPLADIALLTRPRDILLVCDGAQAPGMLKVDVKALGVDTYASSSHKWLLAPKGSGLLYIRKEVQERIHPVLLFSGFNAYTASSGTRDVPQILGHGVAIDFFNALGPHRTEARCRQLCTYLRQRLSAIPHLRPLTPAQPELSSAMVTFTLEKGDKNQIVNRLFGEHNIIVKSVPDTYAFVPEPDVPRENYNALRFSTHIYNSEAEADRLADILSAMLKA